MSTPQQRGIQRTAREPVIVGVGEAASFERRPGASSLTLNAEAVIAGLADAGLGLGDVDGLLTGYTLVESHFMFATTLAEYLGIHPRHHATLVVGGATPCVMVTHAWALVATGVCDCCVVAYGDNRGSGYDRSRGLSVLADVRDHPDFEAPYGVPAQAHEAMMARRYMHEFGVTGDQLAEVAVAARANAARNPKALRRDPITVEDVASSRMVADPLRALDCCLVSNFGGAVVVTTEDRARDLPGRPVYLLGSGDAHSHKNISQAASLTDFRIGEAARRALGQAQVSHADIDVAGVYDGFTISVLLNLEGLGFAEPGTAPSVVAGGLGPADPLPVNTHGGMLACAHGGILHLTEVANQLRGNAGERQVEGATIGLVHGDGASQSAHSVLVLASERR